MYSGYNNRGGGSYQPRGGSYQNNNNSNSNFKSNYNNNYDNSSSNSGNLKKISINY
jgi:hypothetical protein